MYNKPHRNWLPYLSIHEFQFCFKFWLAPFRIVQNDNQNVLPSAVPFSGNKFVAFAQDDDEELVDVEEADTAVKDEGTAEGDDETGTKASPDADTTILFVNPVIVPGAPLGKCDASRLI